MKKSKFLMGLLSITIVLASCSIAPPKEKEIEVSNVEITGFINDYVQVVDGGYKFTNDGQEASITIKMKLTEKPAIQFSRESFAKIALNAIGENGEIFDTGVYGFVAEDNELKKVEDLLLKGNIGDTKNISFKWRYFGNNEEPGKSIFTKTASFELIDDAFTERDETNISETTSISTNNSDTNSNSLELDDVLDSYEKYIDQYIKLYKKAMNGNASAITEYAAMLEKAESLEKKLNKAKDGSLTPSQLQRMSKIQNKMISAMQ